MSNEISTVDRSVDLHTEGYIKQLLQYAGKKNIASIVPHAFQMHLYKGSAAVPTFLPTIKNSGAYFYGQIIVSTAVVSAALDATYPALDGTALFAFPLVVGSIVYPNIFFDDLLTATNMADVSANYFNQRFYFSGYKIHCVK